MWHIQRPLQRKVLSIENKTLTKPSHLAEKFSACEKALIFIVFMRYLYMTKKKSPVIKFLGENPGACPWDEAKKYFSKSLMSISSEYTLQI